MLLLVVLKPLISFSMLQHSLGAANDAADITISALLSFINHSMEDANVDSIKLGLEMEPLETSSLLKDSEAYKDSTGRELRKSLSFANAFSYVVGVLFGSGIFISPSLVARETSNMGMAIVVWVVSPIPCLLAALCYCELATLLKKTGGEFIFIKEAFGDLAAFVTIWAQAFIIFPLSHAILSITIGEHIISPFYDINSTNGLWMTKGVAVFCMLVIAMMNSMSPDSSNRTQVVFVLFQSISVALIVVLGLWKISTGHTSNYYHMFDNTTRDFDFGSFVVAFYDGLFPYDGFGYIAYITEEMENLERDLPLSIVTGIPFVMICYVSVNLALMSVLTHNEIASSGTVATTFLKKIFGSKVAMVIPPVIALSVFNCLKGTVFTQSRQVLSAAREGQLPAVLSWIDRDKCTPVPSMIFMFVLYVLWILPLGTGTQTLITSYSFAVWLTYAATIIGLIVLRVKRPGAPRPFKVWIANPIFTAVFAVILVISSFIKKPAESGYTLVFILLSLPIYYLLIHKHDSLPERFRSGKEIIYAFILEHSNLVPFIFKGECETNEDS